MTQSEQSITDQHELLDWAMVVFQTAANKMRSLPRQLQSTQIKEHIKYYENAVGAAKFIKSMIGKDRRKKTENPANEILGTGGSVESGGGLIDSGNAECGA